MDKDILRPLAGELAAIGSLDGQKYNEKLYRAVNGLNMIRPVVLLDELPWNQLNADGELTLMCEDPYLRSVELSMRRTLYRWKHCRGDMIVPPYYELYRVINIGDCGIKIKENTLAADAGNNIVSHHYEDQFPDMESLSKLHVPSISVNDELTRQRYELLDGIFGDIYPIRVFGYTHAGYYMPWDDLSMWRGVEPIYTDLYDNPELLHAFMRKYLDMRLELLTRLEDLGLLDSYHPVLHCTAGYVDDLPGEIKNGKVTRRNLWGRGTAQVFAQVSPAMHDEFEIEYARKFFDGFGLVYYGCCEPLHDKIRICEKLPNLRKLSITPWADVRKAAEQMGNKYVLSRKPNPASVAVNQLDEDALRKDILETLSICRETGTPCEFILKDISSVAYNPQNLTNWERVVMETVRNY